MTGAAKRKDYPLSMRLPEDDIAIIDRAADLRGTKFSPIGETRMNSAPLSPNWLAAGGQASRAAAASNPWSEHHRAQALAGEVQHRRGHILPPFLALQLLQEHQMLADRRDVRPPTPPAPRRWQSPPAAGSARVVAEWATRRRRTEAVPTGGPIAPPSARSIARLMTIARDQVCGADAVTVTVIEQAVPQLVTGRDLLDRFQQMIRSKAGYALQSWIKGRCAAKSRGSKTDPETPSAG
jgi:hypothetical protein